MALRDAVRARAFLALFACLGERVPPPFGVTLIGRLGLEEVGRNARSGTASRQGPVPLGACSMGDGLTARPFGLVRARARYGPRGTRGGSVERRRDRA